MKKIYVTLFTAIAMTASSQAQTLITFKVDMSSATLGANTGADCPAPAFDPAIDMVDIMGGDVIGWSAPENVNCGAPFTPNSAVDFVETPAGSLMYERTLNIANFSNAGDSPYKFRINHSWDNDELRGVNDGNRHIAVTPGTTYIAEQVFNVDGVTLTAISGVNDLASTFSMTLAPNVIKTSAKFMLALTKSYNVNVKVYDIMGKEVKTIFASKLNGGNYEFVWNGDNNNGIQLNNGCYFYSVTLDGVTAKTEKVYIVK